MRTSFVRPSLALTTLGFASLLSAQPPSFQQLDKGFNQQGPLL